MKKFLLLFVSLFVLSFTNFAQTTLLTEDFETAAVGQVPPTGWAVDLVSGTNYTYFQSAGTYPTSTPFSGVRFVEFQSFNASSGTINRLKRTTSVSTVGYSSVSVDFEWLVDPGYSGNNDNVMLQWSTDGVTWNNTTSFARYNAVQQWVLETVALPAGAVNVPNLYIAFYFTSAYGDNCHMDLVHIKATAGPTITYTALGNTNLLTARTLTSTITAPAGIPVSGIGLPMLYWKKNAGAYSGVQGVSIGGNQYNFTFGAGVVIGDVISYYIVAQDLASTPNLVCAPAAGAAGLTANPPAAATPPTTPSSYSVLTSICGTKIIGPGGDYTTLTAAVTALNSAVMTCPVSFLFNATYSSATETWPIVINQNSGASAVNTLTIKPNTGVTTTITGAAASGPLLKVLNNYTIIDGSNTIGGTTRNMTFNNSSATTPQVIVIGSTGTTPIVNSTLENCILINGVNSSSAVMVSDGAVGGNAGYFNNITIQNNSFQLAYIALYCNATILAGNGNGLLITGNDMSTSGANSIRLVGVYVQGVDGATITNNTIGNIVNTADAANETGIWLATSTVNTTISGNTISNMSGTAGGPRAIAVSSGVTSSNITVTGNTITNISTTTTYNSIGIYFFSTTAGCTISNNFISNIKNSNAGGYLACGIYLGSTAAVSAACNVINNAIWDVAGYGYTSYVWNGVGLLIYSGFGYNIYHNTVYLNTEQTSATGMPSALLVYSSVTTAGAIDMRNNIFATIQTVGTNRYAIYNLAATNVFGTMNYNDYYSAGPNLGYSGGANLLNLAALQTAFGGNANSLSVNPNYVGTDLHPTNAALMHSGFYLAAVPTDITGLGRLNPPDQGAYQFSTNPAVVSTAATVVTINTATLNGTINANNATVTSGFEYGLTAAYGTAVAGVPASVTGATVTPVNAAISGLTPCTLYHYRAKGISGGLTVNGADMTFTTLSATPIATPVAATLITANTATLNGTINAQTQSTTVTFDYGLTVAYGTTVPGVPSPVTGNTATAVSAAIVGLLPGTTYHYRVNGVNACGTTNSSDMTFTTLAVAPTVVTLAATSVTTTTATLNGTVNANGASTAVWFDYGLTVAYGASIAGTPTPVTGSTVTNVSANLTGLVVNTTYHYRVRGVNGIGTTNGNDMTFVTVCPVSGPAGPISGPTQVCQGQCGYVYSVTIPNATGFVWTIPVGGSITSGANTNTITVCYSSSAVSGYVFVYGTAACGNGAPSQLAVAMNPPAAPTIAGPASVCLNSTGNIYSTQAGFSNYIWTVSAGGTVTGGGGVNNNTITITWGTVGAKTVSVNYNTAAGCPALSATVYNVTVNPLPAPTISGPNPACTNVPAVYSTQAGMSAYVWTLSAGGTVTAGAGTNAITVNWSATGAQTVSVNYNNANGCTAAAPVVYPINVNPTTVPVITGTNSVCMNSGYYTYTTQAGMTAYNWSISPGGTINYGSGTNIITVTWPVIGAQWVRVNFMNPSGCSPTAPTEFDVTVSGYPGATGAITGTASVCGGTTAVTYSVAPVTNAVAYVWMLPAGATIASGTNSNTITVDFAGNALSGNISVYANNICGNGTVSPPFAVTVTPLPSDAGTITGTASVCEGATSVAYTVPVIPNASGYTWTVPAGAVTSGGANTNSIMVDFPVGTVSGNITVLGTNSCGNGNVSPNFRVTVNSIPATPVVTNTGTTLYSSAPTGNQWYFEGTLIAGATAQTYVATQDGYYWSIVTVNGCSSAESNHKQIITTGIDTHSSSSINVYPVPNDGRFNVTITNASAETYSIHVYNGLGVAIYEEAKVEVNGTLQKVIDLRPVANGVYTVIFENGQNQVVKKVVVNK